MRIHPQVFATIKSIESLRKQRQPHRLEIKFGPGGLERTFLDGKPYDAKKTIDTDDDEEIDSDP